jgi:histidyl-tRNA synthetase
MIHAIKGFNDIRPGASDAFLDSRLWQRIFATAQQVFESYGYGQVWLPTAEETGLFARGIGAGTDIVSKEMYSFVDRGGRSMTLRPEGTAGAVRSYVEHNLGRTDPVQRWFYTGPMFRAERPQKGRYRQFYQIGAELFGVADVAADAELLMALQDLCGALGLGNLNIRLNTLGDAPSRDAYRAALVAYLEAHQEVLCESCSGRLQHNPLRVLDCKRPGCRAAMQGAPDIADSLTSEAAATFTQVRQLLDKVHVPYTRDPHLVRGLDYYTGVIFEFVEVSDNAEGGGLGSQNTVLGGGRYDNLVQELGGPSTPAVGFSAGVERLALLLSQPAQATSPRLGPHLYFAPMDQAALLFALQLAQQTRLLSSVQVEVDLSLGRLKQQLRRADKLQARHALVIGEQELQSRLGQLKDLSTGQSQPVALTAAALQGLLRSTETS